MKNMQHDYGKKKSHPVSMISLHELKQTLWLLA